MSFGRVFGPVAEQTFGAGTNVIPLSSVNNASGVTVNVPSNSFSVNDLATRHIVWIDLGFFAYFSDTLVTVQLYNVDTNTVEDLTEYRPANSNVIQDSVYGFVFQATNIAHRYQIRFIIPNTAQSSRAIGLSAGPVIAPCVVLTIEQFGQFVPAGSGAFFAQGGNAFGATAVLGTTDAQNLNLIANGATRFTIAQTGNTIAMVGTLNTVTFNLLANGNGDNNVSITDATGWNVVHRLYLGPDGCNTQVSNDVLHSTGLHVLTGGNHFQLITVAGNTMARNQPTLYTVNANHAEASPYGGGFTFGDYANGLRTSEVLLSLEAN